MNPKDSEMTATPVNGNGDLPRWRIRFGLLLTLGGLIIFMIGAKPAWFGLDRSPVVGFVQISVFLVGLAIVCMGGYISLNTFWLNCTKSIPADVGLRLVSTGFVIAVFSGMADVFGMGTQTFPQVPFFGRLQSLGVQLGEATIAFGFLLLLPYHQFHKEEKQKKEQIKALPSE